MKCRLYSGYDLVFLVYPSLDKEQSGKLKTTFSEKALQLVSLFTKAGLLK
jgi:hypothetical protein